MYKLERACVKSRFPRFGAPIPLVDGFLHDTGSRLLQPIRPMLSLFLKTPPQAQLEALRDLRAHGSGSSWLHAALTLLDLFDSTRFDPSGRVVCSDDPSQLP